MKRTLKIILVMLSLMLALICFTVISAGATYTSGYYTFELKDDCASITQVNSRLNGDIKIPAKLSGYVVNEIKSYAFSSCKNIVSITVPDNISLIGANAFDGCENLSDIIVVESNDYYSCDEEGVLFNKDKTVLIRYPVADTNTEYTIPDSVVGVSGGAFRYCKNLTNINIGENMREIGEYAFVDCYGLKRIVIPEGIITIGEYAFSWCEALTEIHIPASVICISESAFYETGSITDILVDAENKHYSSKDGVLYDKDKSSLLKYTPAREETSFTVPETVTTIGYDAFGRSENLTQVTLHHRVKTIADKAFSGCKNIKEFVIPDSVTNIGEAAFARCSSLVGITIPDGVDRIKASAFSNCTSLEFVNFPDSVECIEAHAFSFCGALETVTLPRAVEIIGSCAFIDCNNLYDVIIPSTVISIDSFAFDKCDKLERVHYTGAEIDWDNIDIRGVDNQISDISVHFVHTNDIENPTCTQKGYKAGLYCDECELWIQGHEELASLGHSWNNGESKTVSTCKTKGVAVFTCNNDPSHQYTEFLPLDYSNHEGKATFHKAVPSSCTKTGYTEGSYCTGCSKWIYGHEIIPKQKHVYYSSLTKEATCTQNGIISFTCECKDTYTALIEAPGHKFSSAYTVDKAATCKADGSKSRHCTATGCSAKTDVTAIKRLAHSEIVLPEKKPTCTSTGLTVGKKCKVCNAVIKAQKTVEKLKHKEVVLPEKKATCTSTGLTKGKKCNRCGSVTLAQKKTARLSHTLVTVTQKATLSKNGKIITRCISCSNVTDSEKIYRPASIKLSNNSYTYNNKVKTPSVVIENGKGNILKKNRDFDVSYEKGRKSPGKYTVKITFKGKYEGVKKLYFTVKPKVTSKISASQTSTTITLKWSKVAGADGYRIYRYNKSNKKYEKLKDVTSTTFKNVKLKANTVFKYKVRAYTKDYGMVFADSSPAFVTSTGPAKPVVRVAAGKKGTAAISWRKISGADVYQLYYSTNKSDGYKRVNSYKSDVTKTTKQKLISGKVYYFKLRAGKKTSNGIAYSSWSEVKKVRVK